MIAIDVAPGRSTALCRNIETPSLKAERDGHVGWHGVLDRVHGWEIRRDGMGVPEMNDGNRSSGGKRRGVQQ